MPRRRLSSPERRRRNAARAARWRRQVGITAAPHPPSSSRIAAHRTAAQEPAPTSTPKASQAVALLPPSFVATQPEAQWHPRDKSISSEPAPQEELVGGSREPSQSRSSGEPEENSSEIVVGLTTVTINTIDESV